MLARFYQIEISPADMYKLHGSSQSGNTFKVAFLLSVLNQAWEPRFVDVMSGVTRTSEWRDDTNEMGEVPVLEGKALRLTQSGAILTYLTAKHGAFGGVSDDERIEVLRWLLFDNHKFSSYFASYRFMKAFGPVAPDPAVLNWLRGRIDNAFGIVDRHLASMPYLVGNAPTIADLSLSGYLFYPAEESGYDVAGRFKNISAWLARLQKLDGWADPYEILPGDRIAPKW